MRVNLAKLPRWALAALLYGLFGAVPAMAYLFDGPSETDAASAVAADHRDAIAQAARARALHKADAIASTQRIARSDAP
ncbi:hypothetical protein [Variovorax sp. UC122_21]|uniref:hypothetical protein n=1 Tax=Variovorax sp. UC122_21 TaxID=3374554 RepID=UPI003756A563